tara:strand:+ start:235 stop:555 length:321 start_codon:yes stop_codon:yes gene_type:complete
MIEMILLLISLGINLFAFMYIRWILKQYSNLDSAIKDIFEDLSIYESHAKSIYETEVFYGDATLEGLIQHTKNLTNQIEEYKDYLFPTEERLEGYESGYEEEKEED